MRKMLASFWQEWAILVVGVGWMVVYFFARAILEMPNVAPWLRVAVALLPALPFALFARVAISQVGKMDELQRRVQLEALAMAFPAAILLLMLLGLIGQALDLTLERHVWHYLPICYFGGLSLVWRRYQ